MTNPTDHVKPTAELVAFRDRQGPLKERYRHDPAAARVTSAVSSVTDDVADPSRVRIAVEGPSGTIFDIGAHSAVGGDGELPCSGDVFLASLAGCQEITIRLVAAALGVAIDRLAVRVEGDWDARGTLAVDRDAPVGFTAIRITVDLDTDASEDQVARLLKSAQRYCVVSATLEDAPSLAFDAVINGSAS